MQLRRRALVPIRVMIVAMEAEIRKWLLRNRRALELEPYVSATVYFALGLSAAFAGRRSDGTVGRRRANDSTASAFLPWGNGRRAAPARGVASARIDFGEPTMSAQFRVIAIATFALLTLFRSIAAAAADTPRGASGDESTPAYALIGGRWFDGDGFAAKTMCIVEGRLRRAPCAAGAESVDLKGGFVVPPFGEAHNHNLGGGWEDDEQAAVVQRYLDDGVFYVKILSNFPRETGLIRHRFGRPDSVDAAFANGGITATGGHPIRLRERLFERGAYPGFTKEMLADHAYYVVDNEADLRAKWPLVLQYRPDFVKTFVIHSEEFEARRADPAFFGQKGLNPALLPALVAVAHEAGLRVSVHVNTAVDFRHAVRAGADELAHLPGLDGPERIAPEDAAEAARRGVVVVTTASLALKRKGADAAGFEAIRQAQIQNLKLLRESGVRLAVGSDVHDDTSRREVDYLRELGVFTPQALLKIWTGTGAASIFPQRKIGKLDDGYEASFLVLAGNPLEDWENTRRIRLSFKDGTPVRPASAVQSP
jgi:imidazolonepropionase-like amidohydrolase